MPRFLPKSLVCLREGYDTHKFAGDLLAGLTVGIIALPLAMAFGIASIPEQVAAQVGMSPPAMGLYTAVIAGFLISALGGSRVQIGGPTGAFIVIVYDIAMRHGYAGLSVATLMAGVIVIILGVSGLGRAIKFIPYPVVTGFTSGIAVIIASSQIKDFFGLHIASVPAEFLGKLRSFSEHASTWNPTTLMVGAFSMAVLIVMRRFAPRLPWGIVGVIAGSLLVWILGLNVETIGTRFGGIPRGLPVPHLPPIDFHAARNLIPEATTIAILASIESLLSAVVADGMIGTRHKTDCELVAQGIANIGAVMFGGIPATGAIARTAANIKSGGRTPVAGMIHAVTLLLVMLGLGPLASAIPLPTLAAVLLMVAWHMSEIDHFRFLLRAPKSDIVVLLTTFGLTVFTDLTIAVGVGMVLASLLFMQRMAAVTNVNAISRELEDGDEDELATLKDPNAINRRHVPPGVEVYEINGPFFFGIADRLQDTLRGLERPPKVFILRMRRVPAIDATGLHALAEFHKKCLHQGTMLLLAGVHAQPLYAFIQIGFEKVIGRENLFESIDAALDRARVILGLPMEKRPSDAAAEVARAAAMTTSGVSN
ncbi:MAG: sulfate permease [Planctomycetes bacterium]|nr:sulfate permease [Planctomycetota bacterium]MBI3833348.1 sulfate permease [Planctomycetota bacterium]